VSRHARHSAVVEQQAVNETPFAQLGTASSCSTNQQVIEQYAARSEGEALGV